MPQGYLKEECFRETTRRKKITRREKDKEFQGREYWFVSLFFNLEKLKTAGDFCDIVLHVYTCLYCVDVHI